MTSSSAPLFTVVIPTRNRPALLREAIQSVLDQTFDDFEIVVLENSDADQRLTSVPTRARVFHAPRILAMPDNWERMFELRLGRYVVMLSDKDRLIPSALETIANLINLHATEILTFRKAVTFNGAWVPPPPLDGRVNITSSGDVLRRWFDEATYLGNAPMLYNSAVASELLRSVRGQYRGRLFWGSCPDVASSVLLLSARQTYLDMNQRLIATCSGSWSNGVSSDLGVQGRAAVFVSEFESNPFERLGLVFSTVGAVVETLLACQQQAPELLERYQINWERYVANTIDVLQNRQARGVKTRHDWWLLLSQAGRLYPRTALWASSNRAIRALIQNQLRRAIPAASPLGANLRQGLERIGLRSPAPEFVAIDTADLLSHLEQEKHRSACGGASEPAAGSAVDQSGSLNQVLQRGQPGTTGSQRC